MIIVINPKNQLISINPKDKGMIFMDNRIILDETSFKALSADSRVSILKNLTDRRRTLTELSQKLNLGNSTVKEHCDILVNADLIKQIDEGRKWKYYELTQKGKQLLQPSLLEEVKVLIILSLATIIVGGFIYLIMGSIMMSASSSPAGMYNAIDALAEKTLSTAVQASGVPNVTVTQTIEGITTEFFLASVMISMIVGMLLGWIFTRKK